MLSTTSTTSPPQPGSSPESTSPYEQKLLSRLASPWPTPRRTTIVAVIAVFGLVAWSISSLDASPLGIIEGLPQIGDFLARMWPPDFSDFGPVLSGLLETIQIALVGTILGAAASFVLSLLAAHNIAGRWISVAARLVLNFLRAIPELIYALVFVAALGLGNLPGILALAVGAVGTVGKVYADALESVRREPLQSLEAVGAGRVGVVTHGILPQAIPMMVSYTLLLWDGAVRAATLLGIVGGGGVGSELEASLRTFRYDRALAILLSIMVIVTAIDQISSWIRRRVL